MLIFDILVYRCSEYELYIAYKAIAVDKWNVWCCLCIFQFNLTVSYIYLSYFAAFLRLFSHMLIFCSIFTEYSVVYRSSSGWGECGCVLAKAILCWNASFEFKTLDCVTLFIIYLFIYSNVKFIWMAGLQGLLFHSFEHIVNASDEFHG